ncbi:TlpA family protein disulfide reductase [Spirosoma linguale]|uniref:Alkyl hydroperoxide reductase/ Thiol specific antioxidant/ Mal allergen n=1 Tax=Spirosoma linguale (strain ATCC 33905 / DSM 74 / LMG 10896 / Claus 1) TaxID=504472 RepID=D2QJ91_SPILD|nr:alkyl hydroperoxide reductase/ Thiol specific antioxidant/ Mal allergen [Spirosoma linguale DSM 74]
MKRFIGLLLVGFGASLHPLWGQDAHQLIRAVRQKQALLNQITCSINRIDTLVTGQVRQFRGQLVLRPDPTDRLFGFWFRAKQDGQADEVLYNGHVGYKVNDKEKTYILLTDSTQIRTLRYQSGGRLIIPDLVKLDTTKVIRFTLRQDQHTYYLTMHYEDIKRYDVVNRYKTVQINRATLLPTSVREHQETLDKVQDLFYQVQSVTINPSRVDSLFHEPSFLGTYQQQLPLLPESKPVLGLMGQPAPSFRLASLGGDSLASSTFSGKVVLLDFWEVWCGPCLASMPKVAHLYHKYAAQGLSVYGITHEVGQLDAVRRLVAKRSIDFLTLIGTDQVRLDYKLAAIPLYVLIDRGGKIRYIGEGFSEKIEESIQHLLAQ